MKNYDEIEDEKRDEELRNELIGEYINELNQYGGKKKKRKLLKNTKRKFQNIFKQEVNILKYLKTHLIHIVNYKIL